MIWMRLYRQTWVWWIRPWNVIFLCFTIFFQVVFLSPSCIRVSYSACLHSGEIKDALDRVHRRPANSRSYWRSLAFLFNDDEPAIAGLVVEPAIEQLHFNQHRCQTKDIQKQQPAWAMSEDWDSIVVGFAKLSCSRMDTRTSTLSTMTSVVIF